MNPSPITHVEQPNQNDDAVVYTMLCGESCIIFDDGEIIPEDFDFFLYADASKASCEACRNEANRRNDAAAGSVLDGANPMVPVS